MLTLGGLGVALLMMALDWIINIVREEDNPTLRDGDHHKQQFEAVAVRPTHGMEPNWTATRSETVSCTR